MDKRPRHYAAEVIERLKSGATESEALAGVPKQWHGLTLAHVEAARMHRRAKIEKARQVEKQSGGGKNRALDFD